MTSDPASHNVASDKRSTFLFWFLWTVHFISNVGSGLTGVALGAWVVQRSDSVIDLSLLVLCLQIPGTVVLPVAGALVDRVNRRTSMIAAFVAGAGSTLAILALYGLGLLSLWTIAAFAAVAFASAAVQGVAYLAALPQVVPLRLLASANGLTQVGIGLAVLIAPLAGALLLPVIGLAGVLCIDLATFAIAAAALLFIAIPPVRRVPSSRHGVQAILTDLSQAWKFIKASRPLKLISLLLCVRSICFGVAQTATPIMMLRLHPETFLEAIAAYSFAGIGLMLGGGAVALMRRPGRSIARIAIAEASVGVGIICVGLSSSVVAIGLSLFLVYLSIPFAVAWGQYFVQTSSPLDSQGRLLAFMRMLGRISMPLGILASGPLVEWLLPAVTIRLSQAVSSLELLASPVGSVKIALVASGAVTFLIAVAVWHVPAEAESLDER